MKIMITPKEVSAAWASSSVASISYSDSAARMSASSRADSAVMITVEAGRLRIEGDEATVNIRKNVVLKITPKEVSTAWTSSTVASISRRSEYAVPNAETRHESTSGSCQALPEECSEAETENFAPKIRIG